MSETDLLIKAWDFCEDVSAKIIQAYKENNVEHLNEINVLDYARFREPETSKLITSILAYENDGNYPVWKSFVETFYSEDLASNIQQPKFFPEKQHIDICVKEEGRYAFVFENKLKGAAFQRNQLGRYIARMRETYNDEDIYLVIIPGRLDDNFLETIPKSVWRAPNDWKSHDDSRTCKELRNTCLCDHRDTSNDACCEKCFDSKELLEHHIKVIDREFPEWMIKAANDCVPEEEYLLRSAMLQLAHYIKGQYNIRLSIKKVMESIKVISKKLDFDSQDSENADKSLDEVEKKLGEVNSLQRSLSTLKAIMQMRVSQKRIKEYFPDARVDSDERSFGILIDGVYCGIWVDIDNNNKPYWGFYHDPKNDTSQKIAAMVERIRRENQSNKRERNGFLAWNYIPESNGPEDDGAEIIRQFLTAAEDLGYTYLRS